MIHYENRYFIIDLNRNKLTFIFPLLNYVTRSRLIVLKDEDISQIKTSFISKEEKEKREFLTSFVTVISFLISITTKFILDYLQFYTNVYIIVLLLIMTILPAFLFKFIFDKNKKHQFNDKTSDRQVYALVLPKIKYIVQNIFLYIIFLFFFIMSVAGLITLEKTNIIFIIGIIMSVMCILFQNVLLYAQTEITGKIGRIKWKR